MSPADRAVYSEFCERHALPWYWQPWWLDVVCGPDGWGAALAGREPVQAILPYYRSRRWGLPIVTMPPFTTYGGPWAVHPPGTQQTGRYAREHKWYAELIRQLPRVAWYQQAFPPSATNWLPFYWQGFRQTTRYTYTFEMAPDTHTLLARAKGSLRTHLKKADSRVEVFRDDTAYAAVYQLYQASFRRKGLHAPHPPALFARLHAVLQAQGQSACWCARDRRDGALSAGLYLLHDRQRVAVLLGGATDAGLQAAAMPRLYAEAIAFAHARGASFDFEGSMDPGIEQFFRNFGATMQPYHLVSRFLLPRRQ